VNHPRNGSPTAGSLDDLELELRKLPGVRAAGFEEREGVLLVQLHVTGAPERTDQPVPVSASRIAARHSDRPVAVEVVRWRDAAPAAPGIGAPERGVTETVVIERTVEIDTIETSGSNRPRLLAVLAFPDTDELEVHLVLDGRRTIGRATASSGLIGAVDATIDAARSLGADFRPRARWARALDDTADDERVVVAVALQDGDTGEMQYGLAAGASAIDAAARSTLDALNRRLSRLL
jgi:hypothetical protein